MMTYKERIRDRDRRWKEPGVHWTQPLAAKLVGADYVRGLGYQVPENYGQFPNLASVPFDKLPRNLVLKPLDAHSARGVFLLRGGIDELSGRKLDLGWMRQAAGDAADKTYIAEEYLQNFDGRRGAPLDYKFYCFGPRIAFVSVIERNEPYGGKAGLNRFWHRTADWQRLPVRMRWTVRPEHSDPPTPPFLDEMFHMASDLGRRLNIFVRIDLYATTRGPVFGEFTPTPAMGNASTPLADLWLGSMWQGVEGCGDDPVMVGQPAIAAQ